MHSKVMKKIESMVDKSEQQDLGDDIKTLQLAQNERIFTKASKLFVKKWIKTQLNFVEYFQTEWLTSRKGWYENVRHLTPSTNNGLEATNRVIKLPTTKLTVHRIFYVTFDRKKDSELRFPPLERGDKVASEYVPQIFLNIFSEAF
jgi:hypothetical protein